MVIKRYTVRYQRGLNQGVPLIERVENLRGSSDWRVSNKFKGKAAFYIPLKDGTGWNSTAGADGGGHVLIDVHQHKEGKERDVVVVRWLNYIGKDGMNCRILRNLPLHRGKLGRPPFGRSTEFFFKGASMTTLGHSRKTVFALRFESMEKADDFQMWWFRFNGHLTFPLCDDSAVLTQSVQNILDIDNGVEFYSESNRKLEPGAKRKHDEMTLASPARKSTLAFFQRDDHLESPAKKKKKSEHSTPSAISTTNGGESVASAPTPSPPDSDVSDSDSEKSWEEEEDYLVYVSRDGAAESQQLSFLTK